MKSKEAVLFNCEIGKNLRDNEDFKEQVAYPAMDEYAKQTSISFLGWYSLKVVGFIEYLRIVKPLVRSEEIEKALEEFEGKSIDEIFNQFISQQKI